LEVPLGGERVREQTVGDLAAHLGHRFADRCDEHLRRWVRLRLGREHRRHQFVRVEIALEAKLRAVAPARPDLVQRRHKLTHPLGGLTPRHAEPLLDVGLHL
jgi:hypothetical protein